MRHGRAIAEFQYEVRRAPAQNMIRIGVIVAAVVLLEPHDVQGALIRHGNMYSADSGLTSGIMFVTPLSANAPVAESSIISVSATENILFMTFLSVRAGSLPPVLPQARGGFLPHFTQSVQSG